METCEMCGTTKDSLFNIKVAGSNMKVCSNCKSMGTVIEKEKNYTHSFKKRTKLEKTSIEVIEKYAPIINRALAKKNYTVHQLARAINIKESSLQKYLTNKVHLDLDTARKLENFLEITLTEETTGQKIDMDSIMENEDDKTPLSLGDLIKQQ